MRYSREYIKKQHDDIINMFENCQHLYIGYRFINRCYILEHVDNNTATIKYDFMDLPMNTISDTLDIIDEMSDISYLPTSKVSLLDITFMFELF